MAANYVDVVLAVATVALVPVTICKDEIHDWCFARFRKRKLPDTAFYRLSMFVLFAIAGAEAAAAILTIFMQAYITGIACGLMLALALSLARLGMQSYHLYFDALVDEHTQALTAPKTKE